MKIRNLIYTSLLAVAAFVSAGCDNKIEPKREDVKFTVRTVEYSYDYAVVNVKHNGPEDITWYGFLTEDDSQNHLQIIAKEWTELLKSGKAIPVRKETERNILLEGLKEETTYQYIVFGIRENGELYENVGYGTSEVETSRNIYQLTETEDYTINYIGRNETKDKEIIEVIPQKGGRFGWQYISKESVKQWEEEYKDGYELWVDDVYMTTVNAIQLFALEQISTIQYYIQMYGQKITDLTYSYDIENPAPFEIDRLASGEYYIVVYGFTGGGQHTQTYSVKEIKIKEETADEEYNRWLGTYTFSGEVDATQDNGEVVRETRNYNLRIEHYDNNFMYRIHGWECGEDAEYDWEEDIMQLDKNDPDQFLAFPAYYNAGSLEIRESPMTYITFDGVHELVLGMYGYAYNKTYKEEIPVILDGTPMALAAPIAEGETSTTLNGLRGKYESTTEAGATVKEEWDYCKMGYIAWSESDGSWQTINPAMRLPITITKNETDNASAPVTTPSQKSSMSLFSTKKICAEAVVKNYSRLEKLQPEVFKQVQR